MAVFPTKPDGQEASGFASMPPTRDEVAMEFVARLTAVADRMEETLDALLGSSRLPARSCGRSGSWRQCAMPASTAANG